MDDELYSAPQEKLSKCLPCIGQYLLLAFIVVPIVIYAGWAVYRMAVYGFFPTQH